MTASRRILGLWMTSLSLGLMAWVAVAPAATFFDLTEYPGPLLPIEAAPLDDMAMSEGTLAGIGRRLFRDRKLSGDGRYACIDCHDLRKGGSNGHRVGRPGTVHNVPSIFNLRFRTSFYRNGRARSLEEQALMAIENPEEMASDWPRVIRYLQNDPIYRRELSTIGDGRIEPDIVARALAAYERLLVTPAPFDQYLLGEDSALDEQQKKGYRLFLSAGCTVCHQGRNIGANSFQKLGIINDYAPSSDHAVTSLEDYPELDRLKTTGRPEDKDRFLVPSLRNVTRTAPYLHDGSVDTLQDVVRLMFQYQLGREVDTDELSSLLAFLSSLEGRPPPDSGTIQ